MTFVPPHRWPGALAIYALGGVVVWALVPALCRAAVSAGARAGVGVAVAINLLFPLVAVAGAVYYPRQRTVWAGGAIVVGAYVLCVLIAAEPRVWQWSLGFVAAKTAPQEVAAIVGCGVVGAVAAIGAGAFRRVGRADAHLRCKSCGYFLPGLEAGVCPECGVVFETPPAVPPRPGTLGGRGEIGRSAVAPGPNIDRGMP